MHWGGQNPIRAQYSDGQGAVGLRLVQRIDHKENFRQHWWSLRVETIEYHICVTRFFVLEM